MGRQPGSKGMSPEAREIIAELAIQNRHLDRQKVEPLIERALMAKGLPVPPSTTLLQMISKLKQHLPLDQEWTPSSLATHPIPAEDLPAVVHAFKNHRSLEHQMHPSWEEDFTIRQALWVARTYGLFGDDQLTALKYARKYALRERIREALGKDRPFEASDIDAELMSYLQGAGKAGQAPGQNMPSSARKGG